MDYVFYNFHRAHLYSSGPLLASTLTPIAPQDDLSLLRRFHKDFSVFTVNEGVTSLIKNNQQSRLSKGESAAWIEVYVAYWKALGEILRAESGYHRDDWAIKVYEAWKEVANLLIRGYTSSNAGFAAWTLPCLYLTGKYLRVFAIKADEEQGKKLADGSIKMETDELADDIATGFEKNERLEDAARVMNRIFTLCISDRAPLEESRKWGLYYITNLLFKTYFKLNSIGLSKNILRALNASKTDMPAMDQFPKSHIVTFRYYVGVIHFLDEEYAQAEENFTSAWHMCHKDAHRNKELILTYLLPTTLHTSHLLPSSALLLTYPSLVAFFTPLFIALKSGNLAAFSSALATNEAVFVKRRIYLTLERARELCLRNVLRKVFLLGGGKERTRVKIEEFGAGVRWSMGIEGKDARNGEDAIDEGMENDEVECLIAGLIYKGLIKGYISREHATVVLNKKGDAFPGTSV